MEPSHTHSIRIPFTTIYSLRSKQQADGTVVWKLTSTGHLPGALTRILDGGRIRPQLFTLSEAKVCLPFSSQHLGSTLTVQSLCVWGPVTSLTTLQDIPQGPGLWYLSLLHAYCFFYHVVFSTYFIPLLSAPENMQSLFTSKTTFVKSSCGLLKTCLALKSYP